MGGGYENETDCLVAAEVINVPLWVVGSHVFFRRDAEKWIVIIATEPIGC